MLGDIIKKHRENLNMSKRELAQKLEVHESSISKYEKSEVDLPLSKFKEISKVLKINPLELLEIENYKQNISLDDFKKTETHLDISTTSMLFYDNICVNCSSPIMPEYSQDIEVKEIELPNAILGDIAGKSNLVALKTRGDSMDKIIPEYSLVIIQKLLPYENVESGDIVMYSYEDSWSIKEFIKKDDCVIFRPHSTNPHHKDNVYKFSDMEDGMSVPEILGKVVYYGVSL
jgi:transcriptional regulator with XRE-family HTH domain